MKFNKTHNSGFTMVEMMFGMLILGVVLIAFLGVFSLFQRSSSQTHQFADAQQNARIATDYITEYLRQAGTGTDYVRAQRFMVHAAPYQVAFNADIDNGQTINGEVPLSAIDRAFGSPTVPHSGTTLYAPTVDYVSSAETVVLTLDSDVNGVINSSDQGDDLEEDGTNTNLFVLRRDLYGSNGTANEARSANLALIRGAGAYPDGTRPEPLFQYFYDHDDDPATDHLLWGDTDANGKLSDTEIAALTPVSDGMLPRIRKVRVAVISESDKYNKKFANTGGYVSVDMSSEVYIRNATRSNSVIYGTVYNDADGDGAFDQNETGIPSVEIQLVGVKRTAHTNNAGRFFIPMPAGDYTVKEIDPGGYTSTTANIVSVTLAAGAAHRVDYGDAATSPVGYIKGAVYDDINENGFREAGELGIYDVLVSLDTGEQTTTDQSGNFAFIKGLGTYDVIETDPDNFASSTANSFTVSIVAAGDSAVVEFGDFASPNYGKIEGYVFLDNDLSGTFDGGETGLSGVSLNLSNGDSALTNAQGLYQFSVQPGTYDLTQVDLPDYTSTTVNTHTGIVIAPDTLINIDFGDVLKNQDDFIEITIGNTDRALAVTAMDLSEDNRGDDDIVLGTPFASGVGNMLVFENDYKNQNTAITALFTSTPTYRRNAGSNINSLCHYDFSGDGSDDVLTGIQFNTGNNLQLWFMGNQTFGNSPDLSYMSNGATYVIDMKIVDLDGDGEKDIIAGLKSSSGTFTGGFHTFKGYGGGTYVPWDYVTTGGSGAGFILGEIWAVDAGDVDGDGSMDIVVGSHDSDYTGYMDVYKQNGNSGNFVWDARYSAGGAVNDLRLIDMKEDGNNDLDILSVVSIAPNTGRLYQWNNDGRIFGISKSGIVSLDPDLTVTFPNDQVNPGGEALSLEVGLINQDIFPEVFVGTRNSSFYGGDLNFMSTFGALPTNAQKLNANDIGEVVALSMGDFNNDNFEDVVVGTRTSSTQGKLIIYFSDR